MSHDISDSSLSSRNVPILPDNIIKSSDRWGFNQVFIEKPAVILIQIKSTPVVHTVEHTYVVFYLADWGLDHSTLDNAKSHYPALCIHRLGVKLLEVKR